MARYAGVMKTLPWHAKLVLALLAFLPIYFGIAALGTRIGLLSWQTGLLTMTLAGGTILIAVVALAALIALIFALRTQPRRNGLVVLAVAGLIVPGMIGAVFASARSKAADNPIHDISTDTANPPAFSAETMAAREESGANALSDYQAPLGQVPLYNQGATPLDRELAVKSHAQIITDRDDRPAPLPLGRASRADGVAAVAAAMEEMGLDDIRENAATGMVEGTAHTRWFGFRDDVVARVSDAQIDFRSVSRVGRSDLGANTARINDLRARTERLLGSASRETMPQP